MAQLPEQSEFNYIIDQSGWAALKQVLSCSEGWLLLTDVNTEKYCKPLFLERLGLRPNLEVSLQPGEAHKSLASCELIWTTLTRADSGRNFMIVNLGGGVISDIGGFAASCYKRGIGFINVPTTLLSMVDAAYGGKTGVNFNYFKNQLGTFSMPASVWINQDFLKSLPQRELLSGYAEVLKHAIICDESHWQELKTISNIQLIENWIPLIQRSVAIKSAITERDPFEISERKLLNFGHTIGHALESYFNKQTDQNLAHGFAVAAGMYCETILSVHHGLLEKAHAAEIISTIRQLFELPDLSDVEDGELLDYMAQDKKNKHGEFMFTLLTGIGSAKVDQKVNPEAVREVLSQYRNQV